jgi:GntR family transcriptional repressor for pyruvate dehydrogenase complex
MPLRIRVFAELKEQLATGKWKAGERLPSEYELSGMFKVSRITIHTVIQQLEILGYVKVRHGYGIFARNIPFAEPADTHPPALCISKKQDLIMALEFWKVIEKGVTVLALQKITSEDIRFLEFIQNTMVNTTENLKTFRDADWAFHLRLAETTRNPIVSQVYRIFYEMLLVAGKDMISLSGQLSDLHYHQEVINVLKNGDKVECEAIIEKYIGKAIQNIQNNPEFQITIP